jgi:hypothetical protein
MSRPRLLALAGVVAVAGHQAVLITGHDQLHTSGLAATPHPASWSAGVALVLGLLLATVAWIAWRIVALRWRLGTVPSLRAPDGGQLPRTWAVIVATALAIFLLQENIEHLTSHGHLPLLDPLLSGEYAATVPVFAGLALLLAVATLTLALRLSDLETALRPPARTRRRPARRRGWQPQPSDRRLRARMATALMALRAPPASASG